MKKTIYQLFLFITLTASANAQDLNWSSYPTGSLSYTFTNIGNPPVDATVTVSGNTNRLSSDSPNGQSGRLGLRVNYEAGNCISIKVTFSKPVYNLSFDLIDVDRLNQPGGDSNYQDEVTITGNNGSTNPTITATTGNTVSGNVITGTSPNDNARNPVNFGTPVSEVTIQYCSGPDAIANIGPQVIYIGDFTWTDNPMPVELISFKGQQVANQLLLGWETTSEQNSDHFEVQRSTDARSFEAVGTVVSKGFSANRELYNFSDSSPMDGVNYYRLRQVDRDGAFTYSKIIAIHYENGGFYYTVSSAGPNQILVQTNAASPQFAVYNIQGLPRLQTAEDLGNHQYRLQLTPATSADLQVVRLQTQQGVFTRKVINR